MATYFPQIAGVTTSLPYAESLAFNTRTTDNEAAGKRFASSRVPDPVRQFGVVFDNINATGRDELEAFFDAMKGRLNAFQFLNPGGNLIQRSEDFSHASWTKSNVSVGAAQADPNGGSNGYRLTGSASDSYIRSEFLPDGDALTVANGDALTFTASVWFKAVSAPHDLAIAFYHSGGTATKLVPITLAWQRFWFTWTADTDNALSVQIGGSSTWGSSVAVDVYGPQVAPLPGPGGYHPTPAGYGLFPQCRFVRDEFPDEGVNPGLSRIELPVITFV